MSFSVISDTSNFKIISKQTCHPFEGLPSKKYTLVLGLPWCFFTSKQKIVIVGRESLVFLLLRSCTHCNAITHIFRSRWQAINIIDFWNTSNFPAKKGALEIDNWWDEDQVILCAIRRPKLQESGAQMFRCSQFDINDSEIDFTISVGTLGFKSRGIMRKQSFIFIYKKWDGKEREWIKWNKICILKEQK